MTQKDLAEKAKERYSASYSDKTWSAWKKPSRLIQPDAFDALIKLVTGSAPPALIEHAQRLLSEMNGIVLDQDSLPNGLAPPTGPPTAEQHPPAPTSSSQRRSRRTCGRQRSISVVALIIIAGIGGFMLLSRESAHHPGAAHSTPAFPRISPSTESPTSSAPPQPSSPASPPNPATPHASIPTPKPTRQPSCGRADYTVEQAGDILNEHGTQIDRVVPGDIFVRDMSNTHPRRPYRYYGRVKDREASGYVMQSKLAPGCT